MQKKHLAKFNPISWCTSSIDGRKYSRHRQNSTTGDGRKKNKNYEKGAKDFPYNLLSVNNHVAIETIHL